MTTESPSSSSPKNVEKHTVFLKNGQQVKVNDHVYCSPTWSVRDCTPYSVARIMEFLRPEGITGPESESYHYTRVRLAWYYRPSDVTDRPIADSRLLLAAIYSEVCDINQIRSKCYVVHRDKITDLSGWKKRPDRFYFNKLFDPYIKREFEIIQSSDVRNIPENVRNTLLERYEFVVAEKEVIPDLTDTMRTCDTCTEWCPTPDSVQCDRCKKYFHMRCVNPPLAAKPSRGYGWTCAPCSRKHEEEVDSREVRHTTPNDKRPPKSNAPAPRGRGRPRKDRTLAEKEENLPVKHFKMWPFRYFGQYTVAEDTLDPEDNIFPRTATRVGPKYQPYYPENGSWHGGPDEERGEEKTVEILSAVNDFTEAEIAEMSQCLENLKEIATADAKRKLKNDEFFFSPASSVDFQTEVIRQFSDASLNGRSLSAVTLEDINSPRIEKWKAQPTKHYTDKQWSKEEVAAFEDAILTHGAELRTVREEIGFRSMPEVVRFYGHWKNKKIGEENERLKANGPPPPRVYPRYKNPGSNESQIVGIPDDEESVITAPSKAPSCGACRTRESKVWWKAPRGLNTTLLCDNCGTNWRKYADLNVRPTREDSVPAMRQKTEKRERDREVTPTSAPPAKRIKSSSVQSTPPPNGLPNNLPQLRCVACSKFGPIGKVLQCKKCKLQIHAAVCGAVFDPNEPEQWTCDLCMNDETLEASVYHDCLLCPRLRYEDQLQSGPFPDSFLRACKPTEGQGWAHVICSVFVPEVTYTDASTLKLVEGISAIPTKRWASRCILCGRREGAVVKCSDCPKEYHVPCALAYQNLFGFEIQPVKGTRKDNHITTTFKGETGCMNAVMLCRDHPHSRRRIYGLCETDDGGESALQVYVREYKQAQVAHSHGLLRKARRLDLLLNNGRSDTPPAPDPALENLECSQCHTQFSPAFHPSPMTPGSWLCHRCHFTMFPRPPITNGTSGVNGTNGTEHMLTEVQVK